MARRRPLSTNVTIQVYDPRRGAREEPLDDVLRRLAGLDAAPARVVSLYLDCRWRDEQQRDRTWLTLKDRARVLMERHGEDPLIKKDLKDALAFAEKRVRQIEDVGWHGVARFSSSARDLELAVRCKAELPTTIAVSPLPLLRPLVAMAHGHERALLALVDSREVRVFDVAAGRAQPLADLIGDVPNRQQQGGFSQLKWQHYRADRIDALHKEAAEELARRFDAGQPARVVLGGTPEAIANLERELPRRVLERALRMEHLAKDDPLNEVALRVTERLRADEGARERREVLELEGLARAGGRAAIGLDALVDALNQARPMRVYLPDRLDGMLGVCQSCGTLASEPASLEGAACAACGMTVQVIDAGEALVRAAIALGAEIAFIDRALLARHGGPMAALRF